MKLKAIAIIILCLSPLYSSGGYDNGTSTGKGQFELDLTWNPFDLIEFGQTYAVLGFGLTKKVDIHGYYAHQTNNQDNYYCGIFYQFIDLKYLDLATAIGNRYYTGSNVKDLFFPQALYTIKFGNKFSIGGAFVNIKRKKSNGFVDKGTAFDIAIYLPLTNIIKLPKYVEDINLAFGLFNPGIFDPKRGDFLPTYSVDIIFKKIGK